MSRIIIRNDSKADDWSALQCVLNVMSDGRVSKGGKCYCYVTVFPHSAIVIAAEVTKTGTDKFIVMDEL